MNIPELKVHRTTKLNWDMTADEAVNQLCRKHRFETDKYALFLHFEEQSLLCETGDSVHLTPDHVVVQSTHEKASKGAKKRVVISEEDGHTGMWLNSNQELMSYPSLETVFFFSFLFFSFLFFSFLFFSFFFFFLSPFLFLSFLFLLFCFLFFFLFFSLFFLISLFFYFFFFLFFRGWWI